MNLYIAASSAERAKDLKTKLLRLGHLTKSRWLFGLTSTGTPTSRQCREIALMDLADIRSSDALIQLNEEDLSSVKYIELGFALGLGLPIFVVGKPENAFYFHPNVSVFPNEAALLTHLV